MNHVEIKYSYLSQKAELKINGEQASPYSELAVIFSRSFLEGVIDIICGLDREIFDDYEIKLYATKFQYELLLSMTKKSEYCKGIQFHEIESLFPIETLFARISHISCQHDIFINKEVRIGVYCEDANIIIPTKKEFICMDIPRAEIGIFESFDNIPSTVRNHIFLSDLFGVQQKEGVIYYCVPRNKLDLFWEYYEYEFIILPIIAEYLTALRYAKLSNIEKFEFEAIKNNKPTYYIGNIPSTMDQGDVCSIEFISFPEKFYTLKSENPNIIKYSESRIIANHPGIVNLIVSDDKNIMVVSKTINVIGHQYAEEIRLIPQFEYLKRSERNQVDIVVTPVNAEDIDDFIWKVSDSNIVQVDNNGNIIALEDGKATISVSGRNVSTNLVVEVKPGLQELRFSSQSIRVKSGEMVILECNIIPENAPTENLIWELDNKTIASINPSKNGRKCQVIASKSYEGKGNIRCYDSDTKLGAICNIEVISKVRHGLPGKIALACWIIGIFIPYLLPVSTIASAYGLAMDADKDRHKRYIICAIGSIITLIWWIIGG